MNPNKLYEDLWERIKNNDTPKVIKKLDNGDEIMISFDGKSIAMKTKKRSN